MSTTTAKRATPEELERREDEAYRLRLFGQTSVEIGERYGVSDRQVRTYIKNAKARAVEELRKLDGKAGVMRQFLVLNHVLDESLAAWERSKRPKITKTAAVERKGLKAGEDEGGISQVTKKSGQREEEVVGDPVWLDKALKASAEIRTLLGLDAAKVQALLLAEGTSETTNNENLRTLPPDELLRRYRLTIGVSERVAG